MAVRRSQHDARCSLVRRAREPVTAFEAILCVCFADALGVCRVGADDDFFALGGDHPAAAGVVSRVQRQVGMPLELSWLQEHRTPERLAKRVRRALDQQLAAG